jgi:hypothetical protein
MDVQSSNMYPQNKCSVSPHSATIRHISPKPNVVSYVRNKNMADITDKEYRFYRRWHFISPVVFLQDFVGVIIKFIS